MSENIERGGCLCGQFSYSFDRSAVVQGSIATAETVKSLPGSGKATIAFVPKQALSTEGELKYFSVTGTDGAVVERGFCEQCGSPVFSHIIGIDEMKDMAFIKAGSLDDASWLKIDVNIWESSAHPWSPVDSNLPSFKQNMKR
jgi:hypothetical protein